MSLFHFVRVLFAIALAGAIGWVALVAFNAVKIMQKLEALEAASNGGGGDFMGLERVHRQCNRKHPRRLGGFSWPRGSRACS